MASIDEIRNETEDYALALGYMCLEAGHLEYEIRLLADSLFVNERRKRDRNKSGAPVIKPLVKSMKETAKGRLTNESLEALVSALDGALVALDKRNDVLHSVFMPSTVFDPPHEGARLAMRELKMHETPIKELDPLTHELRVAREKLSELVWETDLL